MRLGQETALAVLSGSSTGLNVGTPGLRERVIEMSHAASVRSPSAEHFDQGMSTHM